MFSKKPAIFAGLVFFAIGLATVLVSLASAQQYKCDILSTTACGPSFGSTDCNSLLCVNTDPTGTPHKLCYPFIPGNPCTGYTCNGVCSDTGAACKFIFVYHCP